MNRWSRIALSLACAVCAEVVTAFAVSIRAPKGLYFEQVFGFLWFASFLVFPGWLLALPVLVVPARMQALMWWQLWLLGTAVGPLVILVIGSYASVKSGNWNYQPEAANLLWMAVLVSFITTALYVGGLNMISRKHRTV